MKMRIGHGYDVHRFDPSRALILGGVEVADAEGFGLLGHSDADVLTHAIMDALLGAIGAGDIGKHFPDTDERYRGISSLLLLKEVVSLVSQAGYAVGNIDATLIAQKPRLAKHLPKMEKTLAEALGCEPTDINIKATTEEGLGFTGALLGMAAHAVCLLIPISDHQ